MPVVKVRLTKYGSPFQCHITGKPCTGFVVEVFPTPEAAHPDRWISLAAAKEIGLAAGLRPKTKQEGVTDVAPQS